MGNKYLYHYTSCEALGKILDTNSIQFSRLDFVDDMEESESEDIKNFGKFCYVSCWTSEEKESIPMWKMYSDNMEGVRIKLQEFPFKKYIISPYEFINKEEINPAYINVWERDKRELLYIYPEKYPQLIEVDYTERSELIYPHVKTDEIKNVEIIHEKDGVEYREFKEFPSSTTYKTEYMGAFKRKCWDFQKEWRYKIFVSPYTYKEYMSIREPKDNKIFTQRMEDLEYLPSEEKIFLELDDSFISDIEILLGPRASEKMINEIFDIASKHGIQESQIKRSEIKIR